MVFPQRCHRRRCRLREGGLAVRHQTGASHGRSPHRWTRRRGLERRELPPA